MRESGQQLLHYRLIEKIGQGGMGSVWRAQDTTLDRDAAIKILPDELANDSQQLARFEREAKLLASLNHPNLASVFGVHTVDSTRFLAMELVPGEDLAHRLQRGPLPVEEFVPILARIADALEAAHAKGVVHRDLKPANVRLTPEGRVKVLDFGLAKAVEGDPSSGSGSADFPLTATGVVLGTAPYMSPEQARGRPVDARADIWSFGCVAWECLTGERPFRGETVPDLVSAILNEEPDWASLPAGTPPSLVRLLHRCLAKKPRERLHHVADARIELEEAVAPAVTGPVAPAVAAVVPAGPVRRLALPLVAAVLMGALGALLLQGRGGAPSQREGLLANARFRKLTNYPGEEVDAAISPDGRFVAFLANLRGPLEAYVGLIGGTFENRGAATDQAVWSPRRIGFQGDGDGIWLTGNRVRPLRLISLMGDRTRKNWLRPFTIHVDWSPDGQRIVYSLGNGGDPVFVADANGANEQELHLPTEDGLHQHFPTWSRPHGRWIYVVRGRMTNKEMDLWRVRPDGTGLEQMTHDKRDVTHPVPIDARTVLFLAREADGSGPWLWELDVDTRVPRRATLGVERYTALSASRDGRRLVATVANPKVGLWSVPILPKGVATEQDVEPHPLSAIRALAPRIRGDQLFYLSSVGGNDGLWRYRDGKAEEVWQGSDAPLVGPAAISPSGKRVALLVREGLRTRLYVINADGTEPRPLVDNVHVGGAACWSPDGEWVAVGGSRDGKKGLFKVRVRDGHARRIYPRDDRRDAEAAHPVWSPDGRMIVFAGAQLGPERLLHAVTPEGDPVRFPDDIRVPVLGERVRFLPDGSGLVYLQGSQPNYDFHLWDPETGRSRPLTKLDSASMMRTFDITPDGKTIVFDRQDNNSDIVLIERDVGG